LLCFIPHSGETSTTGREVFTAVLASLDIGGRILEFVVVVEVVEVVLMLTAVVLSAVVGVLSGDEEKVWCVVHIAPDIVCSVNNSAAGMVVVDTVLLPLVLCVGDLWILVILPAEGRDPV